MGEFGVVFQNCHPEDDALHVLRLAREGDGLELEEDPLGRRVNWSISTAP